MAVAGGAVAVLLAAAPASASCAYPPRPSAHPFTGTVAGVDSTGRIATVRTDDGRTVTVRGSYAEDPNTATTVDRTYQVGVRYEFHPLNDTSPYQDNACTATRPVAAITTPSDQAEPSRTAGTAAPATVTHTAAGGSTGSLWLAGIGAVAVLAAGGIWIAWRRRPHPPDGGRPTTDAA